MVNDTKGVITDDNIQTYKRIWISLHKTDYEKRQMMSEWDINTPLQIYSTGEYEMYEDQVLDIIFMVIKDNFKNKYLGVNFGDNRYTEATYGFNGKDGKYYVTSFSKDIDGRYIDVSQLPIGTFVQFINFYIKSVVKVVVEETRKTVDEDYYMIKESKVNEIAQILNLKVFRQYCLQQGTTNKRVMDSILKQLRYELTTNICTEATRDKGDYLYDLYKARIERDSDAEMELELRVNKGIGM